MCTAFFMLKSIKLISKEKNARKFSWNQIISKILLINICCTKIRPRVKLYTQIHSAQKKISALSAQTNNIRVCLLSKSLNSLEEWHILKLKHTFLPSFVNILISLVSLNKNNKFFKK